MDYNRWYDKYADLKQVILILETLDKNDLELVAQDFLQIMLKKYQDKFDEQIQKLTDNAPPKYSRWYDKNYNLHTCIEFLRIAEDNDKQELINSFKMSLLNFIANANYG